MRQAWTDIDLPPPGQSIGADIYRKYRKGELTHKEYLTESAALVANESKKETPAVYLVLAPNLKSYVMGRVVGTTDLDPSLSKRVGDWLHIMVQALDHNSYMVEHFMWAMRICAEAKPPLLSHIDKLEATLHRFDSIKFPMDDFKKSNDAQVLDSRERERARRN